MKRYDYKIKHVKPQRGMGWTKAVQYMLHSPENIVCLSSDPRYQFRIRDGVIEYHYTEWEGWDCMREKWGNAASHDFTRRYSGALRFDAVNIPALEPEESESEDPKIALLLERIEELEEKITTRGER